MKNMKIESRPMEPQTSSLPEGPRYPYGLELSLNEESLKVLGIKDLPKMGAEMTLKAKVCVCATHESDTIYGKNRNMSLQITDMELGDKD
jgi:hypothetical protein